MKWIVLMMAGVVAMPLWASDLETELVGIQQHWAKIQYQLPESEREKAFESLNTDVETFVARYPGRAEPLIWQGIVLSTYAGAKGGLGALGLVKEARRSLEEALAIDSRALDGSAYTSLGSLYYQVPGWPLGFGDDDKARRYLQKALIINPDGIDANFFFGDFLLEQGEPERAQTYLRKVLQVPGRPGREVADTGRRKEAQERINAL
ncbi:tetratricopeptide repeat protein [Marinobacter salarius]|uniref:tetratricopeptide repeat protein n=1 Tax=Marinobacter salarius TaxID=1420917 RepID=UPI000F852273|nr:tetratricopeptide repeat protein [Marinobacter salarius]AZR41517.1 hypothetical protein MTMN5_02067 [Marinobacter salarius]